MHWAGFVVMGASTYLPRCTSAAGTLKSAEFLGADFSKRLTSPLAQASDAHALFVVACAHLRRLRLAAVLGVY